MFKADYHLHGDFSADSSIEYRELCKKAIERGYQHIAITEHYDLADSEIAKYGLLPLRSYFSEMERLKAEFPQLHILTGLELGEPHTEGEWARKLFADYTPEYIIGSLHITRTGINVSLKLDTIHPADIAQYYIENLEMVETGGFDTLGHLGIFKRGLQTAQMPDETHCYPIIDEIFRQMIRRDISLEVNNSGFKTNLATHIPEPEILKRYKKLGGKLISMNSDSHDIDHFDTFYEKTLDNLRELGFLYINYKAKGKWESIDIG